MVTQTLNPGITVLSLDTKLKDVFYDVSKIETDQGGAVWIEVEGKLSKEKLKYPLLFFDKKFIKVSESLVEIMFPKKELKSDTEKPNS